MQWDEAAPIVFAKTGEKFLNDKNNAEEKVSYDNLDYNSKIDKRRKLKKKIAQRLCLIFEALNDSNVESVFENLNEYEVEFFAVIHGVLPEYVYVNAKDGNKSIFRQLPFDYWEIIPSTDRRSLMKAIENLDDDQYTINKYFCCKDKDGISGELCIMRKKLLNPKYYRMTKNILELYRIYNFSDEEINRILGKKVISDLEKDLNKLLRKYAERTDYFIAGYPRTEEEIERELRRRGVEEVTEDYFTEQIYKALPKEYWEKK